MPELPGGEGEPDVTVRIGCVDAQVERGDTLNVVAATDTAHGWIPRVGAFRVTAGRSIIVQPAATIDERALRLAITGPLLGVILSQRGMFVLHASTVAIGGCAAAFCGVSGAGKSTLAAALLRSGHALLADDITVVNSGGATARVEPGFPRIKLWPDSATALEHDAASLAVIHPDRSKRSLPTRDDFVPHALPLARCYLLQDAAKSSIDELSATEAILSLVKCTYQAQWLPDAAANLVACGTLVRSGVVRRLRRPRAFAALTELIQLIEADIRRAR